MKKIRILFIILFVNTTLPGYADNLVEASQKEGCLPLKVEFKSNLSNVKSFHWDLGNGIVSYLSNPTTIYNQSGYFTIKLMVEYEDQSKDTLIYKDFIHVAALSKNDFNISDTILCYSKEIYFSNQSPDAVKFLWEFGDGNSSSDENPTHTYKKPGEYTVSLITYNQFGCGTAKVKEKSIRFYQAEFSADKTVVCEPDGRINFRGLHPYKSYLWDFGDSTQSQKPDPEHIYQKPGDYDVSLTIEDYSGCKTTISKPKFIRVNPTTEISFHQTDSLICLGDKEDFSYELKEGEKIWWNWSDEFQTSESKYSRKFEQAGSFDLNISFENKFGCISQKTIKNAIRVVVPTEPKIEISAHEGCAPLELILKNETEDAQNISWKINKVSIPGKEISYLLEKGGEYAVTSITTLANGCTVEKKIDQPVKVFESKNSIDVSVVSGCIPLKTQINLTNNQVSDVQWNFGDGQTSDQIFNEVIFSIPGLYPVEVSYTDQFGCRKTTGINQPIEALDTIIDFENPPIINTCSSSEVEFNGGMGREYWIWNFGDGNYSNEQNPKHIFDKPGTYNVSLTTRNKNGCATTIPEYNIIKYVDLNLELNHSILEARECPNYSMEFKTPVSQGQQVIWEFDDGTKSYENNTIHEFSGNGERNIQLTLIDTSGCTISKAVIIQPPWAYCKEIEDKEQDENKKEDDLRTITRHTITSCSAPYEVIFSNPWPEAKEVKWNFGDSQESSDFEPQHIYQSAGTYQVSYTAIFDDNKTDSIENYVTVNIVKPEVDFTYQSRSVCDGVNVEFHPVKENITEWHWNFNDGTSQLDKIALKKYKLDQLDQVKLQAIDANGCKASAIKNIMIGNPYLQIKINDTICLGESIQVEHNIQGFDSYQWNWGNGETTTSTAPSYTYKKEGSYSVSLEVIDHAGCKKSYTLSQPVVVNNPIASFKIKGPNSGCNLLPVEFQNTSTGATEWFWDFGNGKTSIAKNPKTSYSPGEYSITLTVKKSGCESKVTSEKLIRVDSLSADFSIVQNDFCLPSTIVFKDLSYNATQWNWEFDLNATSKERNPEHQFVSYPQIPVKLTVFNTNGCTAEIKKDLKFFKPEFTVNEQRGCYPFEVEFNNKTENCVSWKWDFGDGNTSTSANSIHTYNTEGLFDISLEAESEDGCVQKITEKDFIEVREIKAGFTTEIDETICVPLLVNFTNESIGANNYNWEFGDGSNSLEKEPFHVYSKVGEYDVKLLVTNEIGCKDSLLMEKLIKTEGPQTAFKLSSPEVCDYSELKFTDQSASAISWSWFFGDGNTSNQQHPVHQYEKPGLYKISLLSKDINGCQQLKTMDSLWVYPKPDALFELTTSGNCLPVEVTLKNLSKNLMHEKFYWDFGNGTVSEKFEPELQYHQPGNYPISLQVTNGETCQHYFKFEKEISVRDTFNLKEPVVHELSVTEDNKIRITTEPYLKNNFKYHLVYKKSMDNQEYYLIDTIKDSGMSFYYDDNVMPSSKSYLYKIQTHTWCNAPEPLSNLNQYQTILMNLDNQQNQISLNWNHYQGHHFDQYSIQRRKVKGIWQDISAVNSSLNNYLDPSELCPDEYDYRIMARNLNGKNFYSFSNLSSAQIDTDYSQQKVEVVKSTVVSENQILTEWKEPDFGRENVLFFEIFRSEQGDDHFELIGKVPGKIYSYIDQQVNVSDSYYHYLVQVKNKCEVETAQSNLGSSILLKKQSDFYENKLFWTPYQGWSNGVSEYLLQKKDDFGNWKTIKIMEADKQTTDVNLKE